MTRSGTRSARLRNGRSRSSTRRRRPSRSGARAASRPTCRLVGGEPAQAQRQSDGRAAAGDVVVQVAVERLEAVVEIRYERDEEDLGVEGGEVEFGCQGRESGVFCRCLAGFRRGVRYAVRHGIREGAGLVLVQQPGDVLVREVEAAKGVVRVRIGELPGLDRPSDALLHRYRAGEKVAQVRVARVGHSALSSVRVSAVCALSARSAVTARSAVSALSAVLARASPAPVRAFRVSTIRRDRPRRRSVSGTRVVAFPPGRPGRPPYTGRPPRPGIGSDTGSSKLGYVPEAGLQPLVPHRRADHIARRGRHRHADHQVERGLQLAAQRAPHIGERAVLRRRQRDRHRYRRPDLGQGARQPFLGQRLVTQQAAEQRREQPVLVLRALRPRRDQVRQLEETGRSAARDDRAPLVVVVVQAPLAPAHVLADVVEIQVDHGRVDLRRPLPGRGVEDHRDLAAFEYLRPDQRPQYVVDLVDHPITPVRSSAVRSPAVSPALWSPVLMRGPRSPVAGDSSAPPGPVSSAGRGRASPLAARAAPACPCAGPGPGPRRCRRAPPWPSLRRG